MCRLMDSRDALFVLEEHRQGVRPVVGGIHRSGGTHSRDRAARALPSGEAPVWERERHAERVPDCS